MGNDIIFLRGLRRFYQFTDLLTGQAKPTENRRPTFEVTAVDNLQRISFLSVNFIYLVTLLKNFLSEKQTRLKLNTKTWIFPDFKVRPLCRLYIRIFFLHRFAYFVEKTALLGVY